MTSDLGKRGKSIDIQAREMIANVYHYLREEYDFMKQNNLDNCDLSPLANVRKRTASATGVSERTVTKVLKEKRESALKPTTEKTAPNKKRAKENKPAQKNILIGEERDNAEETSSSPERRINVRSTTELCPIHDNSPDKTEYSLEYNNRNVPETLEPMPQWNTLVMHTTHSELITLKPNTEYLE